MKSAGAVSFPNPDGLPIDPPLPQLLQQCLPLDQVARVEAFREPSVDRGEEVARFGALPLITPQAREARRGAQLEGARARRSRD
jgi:hypothetical protein